MVTYTVGNDSFGIADSTRVPGREEPHNFEPFLGFVCPDNFALIRMIDKTGPSSRYRGWRATSCVEGVQALVTIPAVRQVHKTIVHDCSFGCLNSVADVY